MCDITLSVPNNVLRTVLAINYIAFVLQAEELEEYKNELRTVVHLRFIHGYFENVSKKKRQN